MIQPSASATIPPMAQRSRLNLLYLTLFTLTLVAVAMIVHNNRGSARLARQIFAQARSAATAATTVDDARAWLQDNDFHVVTNSEGVWVSSYYTDRDADPDAAPDHLLVRGHRKLRGFLPVPDRWIAILFRFYPDGTFDRVLLDDKANAPPTWSRPAAAQPATTRASITRASTTRANPS